MKYIIIVLLSLSVCFISNAQTPNTKPVNQDSINREIIRINKLIDEKMTITSAMIDSTMKKLGDVLSKNQFDQNGGAYRFFIDQLRAYWWFEVYSKREIKPK